MGSSVHCAMRRCDEAGAMRKRHVTCTSCGVMRCLVSSSPCSTRSGPRIVHICSRSSQQPRTTLMCAPENTCTYTHRHKHVHRHQHVQHQHHNINRGAHRVEAAASDRCGTCVRASMHRTYRFRLYDAPVTHFCTTHGTQDTM